MARIVLALAIVATVTAAPAYAEAPRPLRVVTYNLFHGGPASGLTGDAARLDARLALVAEGLRAVAPDIVALQEASTSRQRGVVAERLAQTLGFHYVFEPATAHLSPIRLFDRLVIRLLNFSEGPAVLSRFPIRASEVYELPRCTKRWQPRILLKAEVATPWGPLAVFSTHTTRDGCQLERIARIVRARAAAGPVVLTGDLNTTESSTDMAPLNGPGGLVDAFRVARPDAPGHTVYQHIDAPAPTVSRRVDYIFLGGVPRGAHAVCGGRVILDTPHRNGDGSTMWPSDHFGVLAELAVFRVECAHE